MASKKLKILNDGLLADETKSPNKDKFRFKFGTWFSRKGDFKFRKIKSHKRVINVEKEKDITKTWYADLYGQGDFYKFSQIVKIGTKTKFSYKQLSDDNLFEIAAADVRSEMLSLMAPPVSSVASVVHQYEDYSTEIMTPITKEEVYRTRKLSSNLTGYSGLNFEFNYLDRPYERVLSRRSVTEKVIPSMYGQVTRLKRLDTEENTLKAPTVKQLIKNLNRKQGRQKFKTQMVVGDPFKSIGVHEENKYLFPFYSEIILPLSRDSEVANAIQESNTGCCLMRDIAERDDLSSLEEESFSYSVDYFPENSANKTKKFAVNFKTLDLNDWWAHDLPAWASLEPPALPNTSMFISDEKSIQEKIANRSPSASTIGADSKFLNLAIPALQGKISNILKSKARTYQQILDGEPAYSETLLYKIVKHKGRRANNPIQQFFAYNSSDVEEIIKEDKQLSFIDTQVKYGTPYTYVVTAYQAIVGSKYSYHNISPVEDFYLGNDARIWGTFEVIMTPTIKLVEIPILLSMGKVLAPPPLPPDVNVISYKGVTNRMMFYFNSQIGQEYQVPLSFGEEEERNNRIYLRNEKLSTGDEILFKTVEAIAAVEVYRTQRRPENYEDFKGNLLMTVETDVNAETSQSAGSIGKIIRQRPNEKFYYMFRSLGYHRQVSNPSPVYEIELYNDGGVSYPIVRLVELGAISPKTNAKSVRNLIRITPRISQARVNEKASGLVREDGTLGRAAPSKVVLGSEDESLFGKKFKIRITSKDTGKKIDLNINFKTKAVLGPSVNPSPQFEEVADRGTVSVGDLTSIIQGATAPDDSVQTHESDEPSSTITYP